MSDYTQRGGTAGVLARTTPCCCLGEPFGCWDRTTAAANSVGVNAACRAARPPAVRHLLLKEETGVPLPTTDSLRKKRIVSIPASLRAAAQNAEDSSAPVRCPSSYKNISCSGSSRLDKHKDRHMYRKLNVSRYRLVQLLAKLHMHEEFVSEGLLTAWAFIRHDDVHPHRLQSP